MKSVSALKNTVVKTNGGEVRADETDNDVKYMVVTEGNKKIVVIDKMITDITLEDAESYMLSVFRNLTGENALFTKQDNNKIVVNRKSINEFLRSTYVKGLSDNLKNVVYLSGAQIEELIIYSSPLYSFPNDSEKHKYDANLGWDIREIIIEAPYTDKKFKRYYKRFELLLLIRKNNDGKFSHGIANIKKSGAAKYSALLKSNPTIIGATPDNNSISNIPENVNIFDKNNSEVEKMLPQESDREYMEYDKPITVEDINLLREIIKAHNTKRVSINDFTSEDIQKSQKWAYKFYKELGTKSPFFRAWFGDWRADEINTTNVINKEGYSHKEILNNDTGWQIIVSNKVGKETVHHYGSKEQNAIKYIKYIDDITANAILFDTELSNKNNANSLMFHTMYAYSEIFGYPALLRLKVEELYYDTHGKSGTIKRDYILQNIEEETISMRNRISNPNHKETISPEISIPDLYKLVKTYDKDFHPGKSVNPILLNDDDTPKVFYHGTTSDFTVFKANNGPLVMVYTLPVLWNMQKVIQ